MSRLILTKSAESAAQVGKNYFGYRKASNLFKLSSLTEAKNDCEGQDGSFETPSPSLPSPRTAQIPTMAASDKTEQLNFDKCNPLPFQTMKPDNQRYEIVNDLVQWNVKYTLIQ